MILAIASIVALCAIWLGYPVAVAAVAALRPRSVGAPLAALPTVTVVIATRDTPDVVHRRVANALAADYPRDRLDAVVAVDASGAAAQPADLAGPDTRVTYVPGDRPGGKASALNAAVRAARGQVLVFADTAQTFEPAAIRRLVEALAAPRMGAVSGRLEIAAGHHGRSLSEYYWMLERWLRRCEARVSSTIGVTGAIYAMPRALWSPLPDGLILDDLYVPMRLVLDGYRVGFIDDARATDARQFAAPQEFRRKARTLTGVLQLCAWLPGVLDPFRNPVWTQFVCHKLLRLLTPYLVLLTAVGAVAAAASRFGRAFFGATAALALVLAVAALVRPRLGRRMRDLVLWGVAMQGAVVAATFNGFRSRWDVWQRRP